MPSAPPAVIRGRTPGEVLSPPSKLLSLPRLVTTTRWRCASLTEPNFFPAHRGPGEPHGAAPAADGRLLHADVLKVGHSWPGKTSTSPDLLDAVSPSIAVISAGFENSFGHPHPTVLARLAQRHAAILRTDQDGLVTVRSDGHKLWFDSMLWHPESSADVFNWALAAGLNP